MKLNNYYEYNVTISVNVNKNKHAFLKETYFTAVARIFLSRGFFFKTIATTSPKAHI